MHDQTRDPVQWLVWHVVLIKHWFNNRKRKQNDSSSVDQQSRYKRKARACLSLKRLTPWDSIFRLDILQNPNIQNPAHPDGIKLGSDLECYTQSLPQLFTCTPQGTARILSVLLISMASHPIPFKSRSCVRCLF